MTSFDHLGSLLADAREALRLSSDDSCTETLANIEQDLRLHTDWNNDIAKATSKYDLGYILEGIAKNIKQENRRNPRATAESIHRQCVFEWLAERASSDLQGNFKSWEEIKLGIEENRGGAIARKFIAGLEHWKVLRKSKRLEHILAFRSAGSEIISASLPTNSIPRQRSRHVSAYAILTCG
ncbi:MAG: hypothetical protein EB059_01490 [Alphaproteobacteria bacterium]|nr:hypothetical protein [Alphaproteobacteria bacterium]